METKISVGQIIFYIVFALLIGMMLLSHIFDRVINQTNIKYSTLDEVCKDKYGGEYYYEDQEFGTESNITCVTPYQREEKVLLPTIE